MTEITKETVLAAHRQEPRRKCFADNSGVQKRKARPTFSVAIESAKKVFESQTGLDLRESQEHKNYWRFVDQNEIDVVEQWERNQGSLIYLRDCLSLSVALDSNLTNNTSGQYTQIGALEHNGKHKRDQNAINQLSDIASQEIQHLPFYKDADLICSVPPRPDKDFDLPSSATSLVSGKVGKQDVTGGFVFGGQKSSVKTSTFDEKWNVWEGAQVSFQNSPVFNVNDKTVILIDDKYQSGITIQYIAMKLQQAGAHEVYGLSFVKTLRDTDNV
jgi:predicted amidophosphoribosyltransferase